MHFKQIDNYKKLIHKFSFSLGPPENIKYVLYAFCIEKFANVRQKMIEIDFLPNSLKSLKWKCKPARK